MKNVDDSHVGGSTGFQYFVKQAAKETCCAKYFPGKAEHEVNNLVESHKLQMRHEKFNLRALKDQKIADEKKAKRKKWFKIIAIVTFVPKIFTYSYMGYYFFYKKKKTSTPGELFASDDLLFKGNLAQKMIPAKPSLRHKKVLNLTDKELTTMRDWKNDKKIL